MSVRYVEMLAIQNAHGNPLTALEAEYFTERLREINEMKKTNPARKDNGVLALDGFNYADKAEKRRQWKQGKT